MFSFFVDGTWKPFTNVSSLLGRFAMEPSYFLRSVASWLQKKPHQVQSHQAFNRVLSNLWNEPEIVWECLRMLENVWDLYCRVQSPGTTSGFPLLKLRTRRQGQNFQLSRNRTRMKSLTRSWRACKPWSQRRMEKSLHWRLGAFENRTWDVLNAVQKNGGVWRPNCSRPVWKLLHQHLHCHPRCPNNRKMLWSWNNACFAKFA